LEKNLQKCGHIADISETRLEIWDNKTAVKQRLRNLHVKSQLYLFEFPRLWR